MRWLGFEANLPAWSAAALLPTRYLQCVSSFSSNDFTRWSPSVPQKMTNFSGQPAFLYLLTGYRVLAVASIRERRLFRSARLEVWRNFTMWWSISLAYLLSKLDARRGTNMERRSVNITSNNPRLSVLDCVSQLWRKSIFLWSYKLSTFHTLMKNWAGPGNEDMLIGW